MTYTPIVTTLGFVIEHDHVLMVHRTARSHDDQFGKWNGLGGKLEADEDVATGMLRELREEAGIESATLRLRGTVSWPGFGSHGEDHLGFIFVCEEWVGTIPSRNAEGPLVWQPINQLDQLDMWEGDRYFLPLVFDRSIKQFHGVLPYSQGRPVSWKVTLL